MAINVIHYRHRGETAWGVADGASIVPIPGSFATTRDFVRDGIGRAREIAARGRAGTGEAVPRSAVELLCPVTRNQQLVCQGINYRSHMRESGLDPENASFNMIFRKASSCLAPADTDIVRPAHVQLLDYEVEIGLVLARDVDGPVEVTAANLHEFVAALVVVNDVSARDVQLPQTQFYKGKSYRTFGPSGPYLTLVDAAELARFAQLRLSLWVNDELRQDSLAEDMIFGPAPTLTELSGVQDLFAGDLIATGTPGGCAMRAPGGLALFVGKLLPEHVKWGNFVKMNAGNRRFLRPGDRVRAAIRTDDGTIDLGVQENTVVAPGAAGQTSKAA